MASPELHRLYDGDNLDVLRQHIKDESVDLDYLDPPFNSNWSYSLLFKEKSEDDSQAQLEAFGDTWTWSQESEAADDAIAALRAVLLAPTPDGCAEETWTDPAWTSEVCAIAARHGVKV